MNLYDKPNFNLVTKHKYLNDYGAGISKHFTAKHLLVTMLVFQGHTASVTIAQLLFVLNKTAFENMKIKVWLYFNNIFFAKKKVGNAIFEFDLVFLLPVK